MTSTSVVIDPRAEKAVLGSALINSSGCIDGIGSVLRPEHFALLQHATIYAAMLWLWERSRPTDIITVCHELERRGQLDEVGTLAYISSLAELVPTSLHAPYYAEIVVQTAQARRVEDAKFKLADVPSDDPAFSTLVEELRDAVADAAEPYSFTSLADGLTAMNERLDRKMAGIEVGVKTGFRDLDFKMGPWEAGDVIILAALTSSGKTSWALNVTYHVTTHGQRVALFSMEMNEEQIAQRMTSLASGVPASAIRNATLNEVELGKYGAVQGPLSALPLRVDARRIPSVREMRAQLLAEHRINPFNLVVVDLLGSVRGAGGDNRTQEVSAIANGLKALARELEVPILACQQMNRQASDRTRLSIYDIKDSSTVEHIASFVLLLTPPKLDGPPEERNIALIDVAKNRYGEKGLVALNFDWPTMKFRDAARALTDYGSR